MLGNFILSICQKGLLGIIRFQLKLKVLAKCSEFGCNYARSFIFRFDISFFFLPLCSQVLFCGNNLRWVCAFAFKEANNGVYCQAMLDYIANNILPT